MAHDRVEAFGEQTTLAERKRRAGQRLLLGFDGTGVSEDLRRLIALIRPAGFVLFARNVEEPAQVRELNRELASLADSARPALLAVDQEGGRVQRIRAPATVWPPLRAVGRAGNETEAFGRALGLELRAMGFNLNFAPVADVDSNPENPVIGDRAFGGRTDEVADHVATFLRAQQAQGVIACAKHFPGHGDTALDSHHDLPLVEREEPDLREVELPPFRAAVQAGVGAVMTAHVVYPCWDEAWPATLSARIVPRLLRQEMGFEGVVFSDDMEMRAVRGRYEIPEQIARATGAGVDILLCCHDPDLQVRMFEGLVHGQEEDRAMHRACEDSLRRVDALRTRFLLSRGPAPGLEVLGCPDHRDLAHRITERGAD